MANSVASLWRDLDDTLSDEEVAATRPVEPETAHAKGAGPQLDPKQQLITPAAAARHLGRSVETVRRWIRDQRLPAIRIGRSTMLRVGDVQAFVTDRLVDAMDRSTARKRIRAPP